MKKLIFSFLAVAALASCVKEQTLSVPGAAEIGFAGTFVENATKANPTVTTESIDEFFVWGIIENEDGLVFTDEKVWKAGDWTYANTQYWVPAHKYYFSAIAGDRTDDQIVIRTAAGEGMNTAGLGTVTFTNKAGMNDVLYAEDTCTTPSEITAQPEDVKFQFAHLLSKVKFTFQNGFVNEHNTVVVKNIKMTVPNKGVIDLTQDAFAWTNLEGQTVLEMGHMAQGANVEISESASSDNELLTIPAAETQEYTVTFDVELWMGDVQASTASKTVKINGCALEPGKAYNFKAVLNEQNIDENPLFPITFDATVEEWAEGVIGGIIKDENENVISVSDQEGLAYIAELVAAGDDFSGKTINLAADLDLSQPLTRSAVNNWNPIGTEEKPFQGTFNGNGYTIKNLTLVETEAKEGKAFIGFFGYAKNATIKNVTFENVYINIPCLDIDHSQGHIGAVAGSLEGTSTIENVTVKGDIQVYATQDANGASRVAVVAGGNSYGNVTMKNVHVVANEGSYLIANNNTGALAGQLQGKSVFENCSSNIDVTVNKFFAGGLIGLAAGDQLFTNCHTTGNVSVVAGREGKAHDHYRVGGIAGGWADGKNKVCTLVNCSYTGKLSGKNVDGSVAEKFDYLGYVGRGYTLNGCQGSKVVIDGTSFVQKYNTAAEAGIYEVTGANGEVIAAVGSKEDLPKTDKGAIDTNFDENTTLFGDITVSSKETNANSGYGATGVKVSNGAVLDGQGNTLTVNDAWAKWDCAVAATGGTIKNLTVSGVMRGIFMPGASADVYIDNVIFDNVIYTFNSDAGNKNYGVYISNSVLNGWTSHSDCHKEVVYTNCKFGKGNGYAYCRPYGPTTFTNCAFAEGFTVDNVGPVTFENCTLNGVALTSANLADLVTDAATVTMK